MAISGGRQQQVALGKTRKSRAPTVYRNRKSNAAKVTKKQGFIVGLRAIGCDQKRAVREEVVKK